MKPCCKCILASVATSMGMVVALSAVVWNKMEKLAASFDSMSAGLGRPFLGGPPPAVDKGMVVLTVGAPTAKRLRGAL